MPRLLEAVAGIGAELDPDATLERIVAAAVRLTGAQYGAMGVIGEGSRLSGFIPAGMSREQIDGIGHWPEGRGLLGELIRSPRPLRVADMPAHPRATGFPAGHPPMRSFLGVPVWIRDELFAILYLTDKRRPDGPAPFTAADEDLLVAIAGAAGLAVDNARLRAETRRQEHWQRATAEVTQRLLSEDEPREVLSVLARHALEISGADIVLLALPAADTGELRIESATGAGAQAWNGLRVPLEDSVSGLVMASGHRILVDDVRAYRRAGSCAGDPLGSRQLGQALVVPLGVPGSVRGAMTAARLPGAQPLSQSAVEMVTAFAAQAGIGLKLAEHRRDAHRLAVLADRDRIARDLHDLVIQRLFATGMSLQGAMPLIPEPRAADRVRRSVDELDNTIRDIRAAIYTLQSRDDAELPGLQGRIVEVIEEMTAALGFAPALRIEGQLESQVPPEMAGDMLAALREALSNVARHADASMAEVTCQAGTDLVVIVRDNGAGLHAAGRWSGLANLNRRAAELGGRLTVSPAPGTGTRVEWRVPLASGS
ncbi:MAG TPA: GAF domain-containing protein [Streptosporangiaceae bacterium]|nr:GAF domain-containing protein [Streptosporangiaceae bacterium]